MLKAEKIKIPKWVEPPTKKSSTTRSPQKLRRNRPETEAPAEEVAESTEPVEAVAVAEEKPEPETTEVEVQAESEPSPAEDVTTQPEAEEPAKSEPKTE